MAATEYEPADCGLPTRRLEFQAFGARYARRLRRHGRGHVGADRARRPAHHLAGARKRAEKLHRGRRVRSAQAEGHLPDRSAARQHALELAGDLRKYDGGRLSDLEKGSAARGLRAVRYFQAGKSQIDFVLRLLRTALARRASALVLRRRIRALRLGVARFRSDAIRSDDQFYRCVDVRNPSKPVEVGRWWMPGTRQRRQRDAADAPPDRQGLPRPQHQRLSAAAGSLLSRLHRRRHVRARHFRQGEPEEGFVMDQLAALHRLHAHHRAAVRPRPDAGHRRVH